MNSLNSLRRKPSKSAFRVFFVPVRPKKKPHKQERRAENKVRINRKLITRVCSIMPIPFHIYIYMYIYAHIYLCIMDVNICNWPPRYLNPVPSPRLKPRGRQFRQTKRNSPNRRNFIKVQGKDKIYPQLAKKFQGRRTNVYNFIRFTLPTSCN